MKLLSVLIVITSLVSTSCACPACLDVVILADRSSSVGSQGWTHTLNFLDQFTTTTDWTVGYASGQYQFSLISFATDAALAWNLNAAQTADAGAMSTAVSGLQSLWSQFGLTNTGGALEIANTQVLGTPGDRLDCSNVCIIITLGEPTRNVPLFHAQLPLFKQGCGTVIAVGEPPAYMAQLATSPDMVVPLHSPSMFADVSQLMCTVPPPPPAACPSCLDVVILADRSSSVGSQGWTHTLNFLDQFTTTTDWTVGHAADKYQFSVISFATDAALAWNLDAAQTADAGALSTAISGLQSLWSQFGLTNTGGALEIANTQVLGTPGDRLDCSNVCIIITLGEPTRNVPLFHAQLPLFKQGCGTVIAVGEPPAYMAQLATSPDMVVPLHSPSMFADVSQLMCTVPPPPPVCPQCVDMVVVTDISSSVGSWRLENLITPFLTALASQWTIGPNDYQMAMTTFKTTAMLNWNLGGAANTDSTFLTAAINSLTTNMWAGFSNIGAGLQIARTQVIDNQPASRGGCADVCVLITDGRVSGMPQNTQLFNAQLPLFRASCHKLVAIGVSDTPLPTTITDLADLILDIQTAASRTASVDAFANMVCAL